MGMGYGKMGCGGVGGGEEGGLLSDGSRDQK